MEEIVRVATETNRLVLEPGEAVGSRCLAS